MEHSSCGHVLPLAVPLIVDRNSVIGISSFPITSTLELNEPPPSDTASVGPISLTVATVKK